MRRRHFLRLASGALGASLLGCAHQGGDTAPALYPPYIGSYFDRGLFRAPYLQEDARIFVFLLAADRQRLKSLCDATLTAVGEGRVGAKGAFDYVPLAPYVLMLYAAMKISSLDAQDQTLGWMRETEVSFWVPTVARVPTGGLLVPDHLAFFVPYLFVDNPYALLAGREVYGFPKMLGQIKPVSDYENPTFELSVWGFQRFGLDEEGELQQLLEVSPMQRGEESNPMPTAPWQSWTEARRALIELLLDSGPRGRDETESAALNALDQAEIPLVFLKQFPDIADGGRACYQALVEAPARVVNFHAGQRLGGGYQLVLHDLASHPLARILGLSLQDGGRIQSLATLKLWVDFTLDYGVEIWQTTK